MGNSWQQSIIDVAIKISLALTKKTVYSALDQGPGLLFASYKPGPEFFAHKPPGTSHFDMDKPSLTKPANKSSVEFGYF